MKLKLLSWNIWCGTYLDEVIEFLRTANADIIALQEVANDDRGNISEIIAKELGYKYVYTTDIDMPLKYLPSYEKDDDGTIKMGNAILSKYEIVNSKEHNLIENKSRTVLEASVKIEDKMLNIFSVHLRHTCQKQLDFQDLQAENLLKLLPKENTIVMGDFNSLPESGVIEKVNNTLHNTEIGSNTPTWSVYREGCTSCLVDKIIHKLDYIYTTKDIETSSFVVHASKASDHLPVSVIIEM